MPKLQVADESQVAGMALDAWIAEHVMDKPRPPLPNSWPGRGLYRNDWELIPVNGGGMEWMPRRYSTSLAEAWLVVQRFAGKYCFAIDSVGHAPKIWRCTIGWSDDPFAVMGQAETPALAICLAAKEAAEALKQVQP
jgi:hypothetical protein